MRAVWSLVFAMSLCTVFAGQLMRGDAEQAPGGTPSCTEKGYMDSPTAISQKAGSADECQRACQQEAKCTLWTYSERLGACKIMNKGVLTTTEPYWVSGPRFCGSSPSTTTSTTTFPAGAASCTLKGYMISAEAVSVTANSADACQLACQQTAMCNHWTFSQGFGMCKIMHKGVLSTTEPYWVSGPRFCGSWTPTYTTTTTTTTTTTRFRPCYEPMAYGASGVVVDLKPLTAVACQESCVAAGNGCQRWMFKADVVKPGVTSSVCVKFGYSPGVFMVSAPNPGITETLITGPRACPAGTVQDVTGR